MGIFKSRSDVIRVLVLLPTAANTLFFFEPLIDFPYPHSDNFRFFHSRGLCAKFQPLRIKFGKADPRRWIPWPRCARKSRTDIPPGDRIFAQQERQSALSVRLYRSNRFLLSHHETIYQRMVIVYQKQQPPCHSGRRIFSSLP